MSRDKPLAVDSITADPSADFLAADFFTPGHKEPEEPEFTIGDREKIYRIPPSEEFLEDQERGREEDATVGDFEL